MAKRLSNWINNHKYPEMYSYLPGLLKLQWLTNRVLYHRSWLIRRVVLDFLKRQDEISYLDAGCGGGDFLVPFARKYKVGCFFGIDKSESRLSVDAGPSLSGC